MEFKEAVEFLFEKLAPSKIMALASSVDNHVIVEKICKLFNL